ncbi:hypothetical protein MNBD_GAMMA26-170 [hydrothermal vent metagenome]|uniref:SPOR domain-containing protein n=1 Tax=hydrothermal vent metagenome TaxID=652676 RepID=A0A3B1B2N6_9ZZZZ
MARDYKSRANPAPKKQQTPGWIWFFAGLVVGLFAASLAWLKFASSAGHQQIPPVAASKPKQEQKARPPKPNFEFYTVLPEMEVVVPAPETKTQKLSAPAATPPLPTTTGTSYMLQMGSFRKHTDADRMKAELALLGIQAEIQKVSINNRDTFHRVRSGPYHSSQKINQIRALLAQNYINSLLIKLKK